MVFLDMLEHYKVRKGHEALAGIRPEYEIAAISGYYQQECYQYRADSPK